MTRIVAGNRVRVKTSYHWAQGATDTVADISTIVQTLQGPVQFYWVRFDEWQYDTDGDGPYYLVEIDDRYLEVL